MDKFLSCRYSGFASLQNRICDEIEVPYSSERVPNHIINYCLDEKKKIYLYGIFQGINGLHALDYISQALITQLSFEVLDQSLSESDIMSKLRQCFFAVECAFLKSIDHKVAERAQLLEKISGISSRDEATLIYPDTASRLNDLEEELRSGVAVVIALIIGDELFVANVGNLRALLCQKDKSGVLRVRQLSKDHTTKNSDEIDRLKSLSLSHKSIGGIIDVTRCFGNYFLKGGYKEFSELKEATSEPVLCDPFITCLHLDESCSFLLLINNGIYEAYEKVTSSPSVNKVIARMIVEQLMVDPDLMKVAENVLREIEKSCSEASVCGPIYELYHGSSSLLLRVLNFHSPHRFENLSIDPLDSNLQFSLECSSAYLLKSLKCAATSEKSECAKGNFSENISLPFPSIVPSTAEAAIEEFYPSGNPISSSSTESTKLSNPSLTQLTLDEDGRIEPYVSFDEYYSLVADAIANGIIHKSRISFYK